MAKTPWTVGNAGGLSHYGPQTDPRKIVDQFNREKQAERDVQLEEARKRHNQDNYQVVFTSSPVESEPSFLSLILRGVAGNCLTVALLFLAAAVIAVLFVR